MDNLSYKIIAYLGRTPDFNVEIKLVDDMVNNISNPYIKEWNATDKPKPTDEELNNFSTEAQKIKNNQTVLSNRRKEYGSVETQLEFLVENGVDSFITRQNAIKTKYPKESE